MPIVVAVSQLDDKDCARRLAVVLARRMASQVLSVERLKLNALVTPPGELLFVIASTMTVAEQRHITQEIDGPVLCVPIDTTLVDILDGPRPLECIS